MQAGQTRNCPKRDFFFNSVTLQSSAPLADEHVLNLVCRRMRQKPVVVVTTLLSPCLPSSPLTHPCPEVISHQCGGGGAEWVLLFALQTTVCCLIHKDHHLDRAHSRACFLACVCAGISPQQPRSFSI